MLPFFCVPATIITAFYTHPHPNLPLEGEGENSAMRINVADHSTFNPAALTTFAHFTTSAAMVFVNSSGDAGIGSAPSRDRISRVVGSCRIRFSSLFNLMMIGFGVFAAARMPYQPLTS